MNKAELITKVSEKANNTEGCQGHCRHPFDGMKESLEGDRIEIRGFGSFMIRNYWGYKNEIRRPGDRGCPSEEASSSKSGKN
jgi:hypothetical protein